MGLFDMVGNHLKKGQDLKLKLFALLDSGKYDGGYGVEEHLKDCLKNYERGYTDSLFKNIEMDMKYKYNLEDEISGSSEKWLAQGIKEFLRQKEMGKSFR